jgi:thrombospondin type 3 repeat protein/NHL repeat-containing protein
MPPSIDDLSPRRGWPGELVVITGREFHSTPQMDRNRVTFAGPGGTRVEATVVWASPNEIRYSPDRVIDDRDQRGINLYPVGLIGPEGIAVSARGELIVAVTGQGTVKWTWDGGTQWGVRNIPTVPPRRFDHPAGVAVDEAGDVYVANSGLHRIEKYVSNLFDGGVWGSEGGGDGEFRFPRAVDAATIDDVTFVFVADTHNNRVVRTRADGSGFLVFQMPEDVGTIHGVAAHPAGDVYCSDPNNHRVLHFDADGRFQGDFGTDELSAPLGIDVDFDGFIYVVDNRTIKKFDTDFRLIAEFGVRPGLAPQVTPPEDLVDPVDVAVGDDKAVWIVDRSRNHVVRWIPEDAQEIWVHVPATALSGEVIVETDDGPSAGAEFFVFRVGSVTVNRDRVFVTQGIAEHEMVAGKRTAIIAEVTTPLEGEPNAFEAASWWGNPATDTTRVTVRRDGTDVGTVENFRVEIFALDNVALEAVMDVIVELPLALIDAPGLYEFEVLLQRAGDVAAFAETVQLEREVKRRKRLRLGAQVLSHLRFDGTPIPDADLGPSLFGWLGDPEPTLSWVDMNSLLLGFANFNRVFPIAHDLAPVENLFPAPTPGLSDGVTDDEVLQLLGMLERERLVLNEETAPNYNFLVGVLNRAFTPWEGIMSDGSGYKTALVTIETLDGTTTPDVGVDLAHELNHLYGGDHGENEFVETSFPFWHSLRGIVNASPRSLMFVTITDDVEFSGQQDDDNAFFDQSSYSALFADLANPHPTPPYREDVLCDSTPDAPKRPPGSRGNISLVGLVDRAGKATITYCAVGGPHTPVTPLQDSEYTLVQVGAAQEVLARWPVSVSFRLVGTVVRGRQVKTEQERGAFRVTAPWLESTCQIRLEHNGIALAVRDVPSGLPHIEILSPRGGEHLGVNDTLEIRWVATHSGGASLTYRIHYSHDGGHSYQLLGHDVTATTLLWPNRGFPGSSKAVIRVAASDGFHTVSALSPPFVVERKPPHVRVIWPRDGQVVAAGQPLRMIAVARDPEDGVLDGHAITWWLDDQIELGHGAERDLLTIAIPTPRGELHRALPVGGHTLIARVIDRDGKAAEASVTIVVAVDSDGDGYTDEEESALGTDPNDPLDHPGNVHVNPFGQWQFSRDGLSTRFEISNLTAHPAVVQMGLVRENGQPLRNHPVQVREGASMRIALTDAAGQWRLRLGSHGSSTYEIHSIDDADPTLYYGYGTIKLLTVQGSSTARFLAHGWIRQAQAAEGDAPERAFEGTVVVHGGQPFTLRAPRPPQSQVRPRERRRFRRKSDLGHLINAASKGKAPRIRPPS